MKIKAILVDLDGTLIDSQRANFLAYSKAFKAAGLVLDTDKFTQAFGMRADSFFALTAPNQPSQKIDEIRLLKNLAFQTYFDQIKTNDELISFLKSVRPGLSTALVTSASRKNADLILRHFGLTSLFDHFVFGEDVVQAKPAPDPYLLAVKYLELKPSECLVFEDTETGELSATSAGCNVMRVQLSNHDH